MKSWIKTYENKDAARINMDLLNRTIDGNLIDYIINTCKTLEALPSIEFLGYEYIDNEMDIDFSRYISEKQRGREKNNKKKYRHLSDSRLAEIRLKFRITHKDEVRLIDKPLLLPIADENGYFLIDGTKYFLMYQITEKSTYTTKDQLVGKSTLAIPMKRFIVEDYGYTIPIYTLYLFGKDMNVIQLFFAHRGFKETMKYFGMDQIIDMVDRVDENDTINRYLPISSKLYIKVNTHFFEKFNVVRSIVAMIHKASNNRLTLDKVHDKVHWITMVGSGTPNKHKHYDKGISTLLYLERMLDGTTKENLLVHPINKVDTYAYLRWMMLNFDALRAKNNMDLGTKRLRCNEYIAHLLSITLTERVNRIIALGSNATIENISEIFKFPGDVIIKSLHKSGLLKFDDRVNDMDLFTKLKVTFKGPSSLGAHHDRTVSVTQRGLDPSYLGRLDINRCGTSDPGMSAVLTPYCKTYGLCFDDSSESDEALYEFNKYTDSYRESMEDDEYRVTTNFETKDDYYDAVYNTGNISDKITIYSGYREDEYYIIES